MRATIIHGPGDIRVEDRNYPTVQLPTDRLLRLRIGPLALPRREAHSPAFGHRP